MYILLSGQNTVSEIIPDENPVFPGVPIDQRYAPDFIEQLIHVPDDTEVAQNWIYDFETGGFSPPPEPEELPGLPSDQPAPERPEAEDLAGLVVEHEYRLTLLELGLAGGEK